MMTAVISKSAADKAKLIVGGLKRAGIDLVATLPDAWLTDLLETINADQAMTMVRVPVPPAA